MERLHFWLLIAFWLSFYCFSSLQQETVLTLLLFTKWCVSLCSSYPATILSCGWIIYLTYYNSRNIGLILTLIINRLYKDGYIHIGERVRTSEEWWWTGRWNSAKDLNSLHWIFNDEPLPSVIIHSECAQKTAALCVNDTGIHSGNTTNFKLLIAFPTQFLKLFIWRVALALRHNPAEPHRPSVCHWRSLCNKL